MSTDEIDAAIREVLGNKPRRSMRGLLSNQGLVFERENQPAKGVVFESEEHPYELDMMAVTRRWSDFNSDHLTEVVRNPPPLTRAGASVYGSLLRAIEEEKLMPPPGAPDAVHQRYTARFHISCPVLRETCPFVINHDWAAVLKRAGDPPGSFSLPAELCVFEMAFGAMRAIVFTVEPRPGRADSITHIFLRLDKHWIATGYDHLVHPLLAESNTPLFRVLHEQIRAACIMLETQVAETQVVRADYRRNAHRVKQGKLPFFDYHRVDLANRHRYALPEERANEEKRRSPRLHFVRSHDRHFDNYKVKIPWHYRGDADLGFIDKEYSL